MTTLYSVYRIRGSTTTAVLRGQISETELIQIEHSVHENKNVTKIMQFYALSPIPNQLPWNCMVLSC